MRRPSRFAFAALFAVTLAAPFALDATTADSAPPPAATRTLEDYRHFRIAAIDLLGRMPTRDEIAAFERSDFDMDGWMDAQLGGAGYVERLTRIYMDALRLEPNVDFRSAPSELYRHDVLGPDGKPVTIYYREGQRRERPETDGEFCLSPEETGVVIRARQPDQGTPRKVSQKVPRPGDACWRSRGGSIATFAPPAPPSATGADGRIPIPEYKPVESLLTDAEGKPVVEIRVCREEAGVRDTGHVYASGRVQPLPKDAKLPGGRLRPPPLDRPYATQHQGQEIACNTRMALDYRAGLRLRGGPGAVHAGRQQPGRERLLLSRTTCRSAQGCRSTTRASKRSGGSRTGGRARRCASWTTSSRAIAIFARS